VRSGARNLARLAEETFERRGDYPALWFDGDWYSSQELFERAMRIDLGVEPGDRVVVLMENSPDVGIAYHAIWRAGAVVTPAVFLLTRDELERLIRDAEPTLVLTSATFADTAPPPATSPSSRTSRNSRARSRRSSPATNRTSPRSCTPGAPPAARRA
jgi:long-chain acyl-CoA synthetase